MITRLASPPTLDQLRAHREQILSTAARYGVYDIRVFGSVARGSPQADSDVDLMVRAAPGTDMFALVGLWLDLQELLGCKVSVVAEPAPDDPFMQRVQADLVAL